MVLDGRPSVAGVAGRGAWSPCLGCCRPYEPLGSPMATWVPWTQELPRAGPACREMCVFSASRSGGQMVASAVHTAATQQEHAPHTPPAACLGGLQGGQKEPHTAASAVSFLGCSEQADLGCILRSWMAGSAGAFGTLNLPVWIWVGSGSSDRPLHQSTCHRSHALGHTDSPAVQRVSGAP